MTGEPGIAGGRRIERSERRGVGLAEENGAGASKAAHDVRVEGSLATFIEAGAVFGGKPASLEDILHAERHAIEKSLSEGDLGRYFHPGANLPFTEGDAPQTDFEQVGGGLLAGFEGLEEVKQHYMDQSSLKKPACTIFPAKRESGGTVMSTMA